VIAFINHYFNSIYFIVGCIIVRFDADGQLITLTDGLYTPKGNVRLSFVDHGADLSKEGAQSLAVIAEVFF
jgi:hypothetical protein